MRTTITLDDDLAETLKRRARERDVPFKRVVNETLRAGLAGRAPATKPYRMKPRRLGVHSGVNLTKALSLAAEIEDAEVARELAQGR
ncbi:MAG: hypothetical protein V7607_2537 [Solirubrobacteraceae bacterium]